MATRKNIAAASIVLATALMTAGCSSLATSSATPSNSASASQTPKIEYETAPLTGVSYVKGTNAYLQGPAVMGKVDNAPDARPQNSLNQADIVFEEMVEGGMTRFLAIWQSQLPEKFGPVRSVRPMDPDLGSPFGGIISFSGGQRPFVEAMMKTDVFVATETNQLGKGTFKRVSDRVSPHNVMVFARKLAAEHTDIASPKPQFDFAPTAGTASASSAAKTVTGFSVSFPSGQPSWAWNPATGVWLRSQYGKAETDATDGQQLHAANVVVLKTKIDRSFKDFKYGYVPRTIVVGGGTGFVFSSGKSVPVTFQKANQNDSIHLFDAQGNPVLLAVGNTWIELMPSDVGRIKIKYAKVTATGSPGPTATR
jgi:Protein of unknown function (DUF3048) N-terminal domain/Protein of unknown function (DUF3048) C-terminal domain